MVKHIQKTVPDKSMVNPSERTGDFSDSIRKNGIWSSTHHARKRIRTVERTLSRFAALTDAKQDHISLYSIR